MSELFVRLEPPTGGRDRLHRGLERRTRRRRRNRVLVASAATLGLALVSWLSRPIDAPTVVVPDAIVTRPLDPSLHPAIAVRSGSPASGAELLDGAGTLRPIATQASDVILYVHDPS